MLAIKVRVPEFEIELGEVWGTTPQEVADSLPKHYREFQHFLEEQAPSVGTVNIRSDADGFKESVDFVFGAATPPRSAGG